MTTPRFARVPKAVCLLGATLAGVLSLPSVSKAQPRVTAWGDGSQGQLGRNSLSDSLIPTGVVNTGALAGKTITQVCGGYSHSLALASDGTVYSWGLNSSGQLGTASTSGSWVPVAVSTSGALFGKTVTQLAAGQEHSLALASDGKVYSWGSNAKGQLGSGGGNSSAPVAVDTSGALAGKTIIQIAASNYHSLALASDGTAYAWGYGGNGELGNGTSNIQPLPGPVLTNGVLAGKNITQVAAGANFSLALTSDGGLYSWGNGVSGQLGWGSYNSSTVPVAVKMDGALLGKKITSIACGASFALALSDEGRIYGWGENYFGQLGIGTSSYTTVPVATSTGGALSGKTISTVSVGVAHTLALDNAGQVYTWGLNNRGQLGLNHTTNALLPTPIFGNLTGVSLLAGGGSHGLALGVLSNLPPTANNQSTTVRPGQSVQITLTASDPEKDPLTYSIVNPPSKGVLSGTAPNLTYTANADFAGDDWFRFKANDGTSDSNVATVSIILAEAPSLIVTTTSDSSTNTDHKTSLREAINYANTRNGGATISFNIPTSDSGYSSGVFTIRPISVLPTVIANGTTIDGGSQTAFTGNTNTAGPEVAINGGIAGMARGLSIESSNCLVKQLIINGFNGQGLTGIRIAGRTLIATGNRVEGCYIGTNSAGSGSVSNWYGVELFNATGNTIGGLTVAERNIISGNSGPNIYIWGSSAQSNLVQGNYIGTNAGGTASLNSNSGSNGVQISSGARNNTIGGTTPGAGNVISGNFASGIAIVSSGTSNNTVQGNLIGLNAAGTGALANRMRGVVFDLNASGNTVGGSTAGRNRIAYNTAEGIAVIGSAIRNSLRYNEVFSNGKMGIDLMTSSTATGVTANDSGDSDQGPNLQQNFPVLTSAVNGANGLTVRGTLNSTASITAAFNFTIDFYASPTADSSGYGEGQTYLGAKSVTTDGSGNAAFVVALPAVALGQVVTATATDANGNTSEFSQARTVVANSAPVANNQTVTVARNTSKTFTLSASDVDGDSLTYTVLTQPTNGTLSGTAPNLTYTPNASYVGEDSFTFKAHDGMADSNVATVSITATNTAPVANNQSVTLNEDSSATVTVTASDVNGDGLTYSIVNEPLHGRLSGTAPNLTYTPNADYFGADSFTFKVNDGTVDSNTATVSITVVNINDVPVPVAFIGTTLEDTPFNATLSATDADGDTLTYRLLQQPDPKRGVFGGTAPNLVFTPVLNYNGPVAFHWAVSDGKVEVLKEGHFITVTPVNDAPVATNRTITMQEEGQLGFSLNNQASDVEGDAMTFTIVEGPSHGAIRGDLPGVIYTPEKNFNGTDSFTFRANDGAADSNIGTITITVTPVNDAPVANSQSVAAEEDTPLDIVLTGSDVDGDTLTYALASQPQHGTLSGTAPNLIYTPAANYNGADSFTFQVNDGTLDSNVATISITVDAGSDEPVAVDDSYSVKEDAPLNIPAPGVLANDTDPDGDALTAVIVAQAQNGTVELNADGSFSYVPDANFNGTDSFTYKASDGAIASATVTVGLTIEAVNDVPSAEGQSVTLAEDTVKAIVLGTSDVDEDDLTYTIVSTPVHGTLSGTAPHLIYTPHANYSGADSFTFKANDGTTDSNTATFSINITPVNDAPVAEGQAVNASEDEAKSITLAASDLENDALSYVVVEGPTHGTLSGTAPNLTYTPDANYNGADSFTFQANDGNVDSNPAKVTMSVSAKNDAPVAQNQSAATNEDQAKAITLGAGDIDNDALTYGIVTLPQHGTLSGSGANRTYTPNANYSGSDSFTFKAGDGTAESNTATVSVTVAAVNDAPSFTLSGTSLIVKKNAGAQTKAGWATNISAGPADESAQTRNFLVSNNNAGLFSVQPLISSNGTLTFTPAKNKSGTATVSVKLQDSGGTANGGLDTSSTQTFTIRVN